MNFRKHIILVIIAASSIVADAVTGYWSGAKITPQSGDSIENYSVYLFDAAECPRESMLGSLQNGVTSKIDYAIAQTNAYETIEAGVLYAEWGVCSLECSLEKNNTYYTVIFNDSADKATSFMITCAISPKKSESPFPGLSLPAMLTFGAQTDDSSTNSWLSISRSEEQPKRRKGFRIIIR